MPRKPAVPPNLVIETLLKYSDDVQKNLTTPTSEIWNTISIEMNKLISPAALYTIVKCNRYNCLQQLGIQSINNKEDLSYESDNSSEEEYTDFFFNISYNTWITICPEYSSEEKCTPRKRFKLKSGWSHIFYEKLSTMKTSCIWMFKSNNISFGATYFLNAYAYCKECDAKLHLMCYNEPKNNEDVDIYCKMYNVKENLHTFKTKRPLSGNIRYEVGKSLMEGNLAVNYRREKARNMPNDSRTIYELNTLRKCKQEYKDKTLYPHITKGKYKTETENIQLLKYTQPYISTLKTLSLDPFFIHYWTNDQLQIYNSYCNQGKTSILALDATGSLCNKLDRPYDQVSGHIFLYSGVIHLGTSDGQIPVVQMLSEVHSINFIALWLNEWIYSGARTPNIVVCDFSFALLGAICKTFGQRPNLKCYMEDCFNVLRNLDNNLPPTYIRIDHAHLINAVTKWSSLKNKRKLHKEFYIRLFSKLMKCVTLPEFEIIATHLLTVAYNEYEGHPAVIESNRFLKRLIADRVPIYIEENEINEEFNLESLDSDIPNNIIQWIDSIKSKVNIVSEELEPPNYYCNPDFAKDLLRMMKTFTLWSAIMIRKFNCGSTTCSSSIVESYFQDLKSRSLKSVVVPMNADKFLVTHINTINGQLVLAQMAWDNWEVNSNIENVISQEKTESDTEVISDNNATLQICAPIPPPVEQENKIIEKWRGLSMTQDDREKIIAIKATRPSYYGAPCTEIMHIKEVNKVKIDLVKNGHMVNRRYPEKIENNLITLSNTCPFDSLLQLICTAYCDSLDYGNFVNNLNDNNEFINIVKFLVSHGVRKPLYQLRASLLMQYYPKETLKNGTIKVSCESNVTFILEKIFKEISPSYTEIKTCLCGSQIINYTYAPVNINIINDEGIKNLQESISFHEIKENNTCHKCQSNEAVTRELGTNLFIETNGCNSFILRDIPAILTINNKTYILRGVVKYEAPKASNSLGHYIAYCRRVDAVWECYDDLRKKMYTTTTTLLPMICHVLLYTI